MGRNRLEKEFMKSFKQRTENLDRKQIEILEIFLPKNDETGRLVEVKPLKLPEIQEKLTEMYGYPLTDEELTEILRRLVDNNLIQIVSLVDVDEVGRTKRVLGYVFADQFKLFKIREKMGLNEVKHPIEVEMFDSKSL